MPNNNPTGKNQYTNRKPQQQPSQGNETGTQSPSTGGQRIPESD